MYRFEKKSKGICIEPGQKKKSYRTFSNKKRNHSLTSIFRRVKRLVSRDFSPAVMDAHVRRRQCPVD